MTRDSSSNNRPWPPLVDKPNFTSYTLEKPRDLSLNAYKRGVIPSIRKNTDLEITLSALALSVAEITEDAYAIINILNATTGSTITLVAGSLPPGMTLNSAARTITGTPPDPGVYAFTLRETKDGATNSPRDTSLSITVAASSGVIQSVTVLEDGMTIRVRGTWDASTWADFSGVTGRNSGALFSTSDYAARNNDTALVLVTASGPGFDRVGDQAVANSARTRVFPAHQVRPRPYPQWPNLPQYETSSPNNGYPEYFPQNRVLPETDLGGGVREIDILLWEPVQPGDTVTVEFRDNWRTGLPAQTVTAVNNSTTPIEAPAFRWIEPPFQVVRDATSFQVDCLAAHVLPEGKMGVAGIRIIATDGTNKTTSWLSVGTSTKHGDSVRCWTGNVDLTGLNPGGIALFASVYPWRGPVRHLTANGADPATEPAASLHPGASWTATGTQIHANRPLLVAYDPNGTRYSYTTTTSQTWKYVCVRVNPTTGTTTSPTTRAAAEALCGFGNTREAARAAAQALSGVADQRLALDTLARLGRSLTPANGVPTAANDITDMEIAFDNGDHTLSTATQPITPSCIEGWTRFWGSSRDSVRIFVAATGTNRQSPLSLWENLDIKFRPTVLGNRNWHQNCYIGLAEGQPSGGAYWSGAAGGNNEATAWLTNCRQTGSTTVPLGNGTIGSSNARVGLARSVEFLVGIGAPTIVNCTKLGTNTTTSRPFNFAFTTTGWDELVKTDFFVWGSAAFDLNRTAGTAFETPSVVVPGDRSKIIRFVCVNNLVEYARTSSSPILTFNESGPELDLLGCVIEGNTFVGQRGPHIYADPTTNTLEEAETFFTRYIQFRYANNYCEWLGGRGDTASHTTTETLRSSIPGPLPKGVRPQLFDGHAPAKLGAMFEGNVISDRTFPAGDRSRIENCGLGAVFTPNPNTSNTIPPPPASRDWPAFTLDRSRLATTTTGNGDYRPASGSPLLNRATNAQIDVYRTGETKAGSVWAAGSEVPA